VLEALQVSDSALSRVRGRYSSFSLTLGMSLAPSDASTSVSPEYQLMRGGGRPVEILCHKSVHSREELDGPAVSRFGARSRKLSSVGRSLDG
jgi:hypothetical protein